MFAVIAKIKMATIAEGPPPTAAATRKRKTKDLSDSLAYLNESNFRFKVKGRLEEDNKDPDGEVMVAYGMELEDGDADGDGSPFELNSLTIDQMRKLCRNVGVSYVNKCTKFQCRKALWVLAKFQEQRNHDGGVVVTASEK